MRKIKQEGTVKIGKHNGFYIGFNHETRMFFYNPNGKRTEFKTLRSLKDHIGNATTVVKMVEAKADNRDFACWGDYYEACVK